MNLYVIRYTSKLNKGLCLQFSVKAISEDQALSTKNPWGLEQENYYVSIKQG